jgi:ribose transport system ATP-binding protein
MTDALLKVTGASKSFGGVSVLRNVDLEVQAGQIHALLGENGAGKSTLMKILCGIHQPDGGVIAINGATHRFASYEDATQAGVGIVFQEFSLIPDLNAVDNIFLGRELRTPLGLLKRAQMRAQASALLGRLGVEIDLSVPIRLLSVAQQQFIEIAKALSVNGKILVLDEPTATLTPAEAEHLFKVMRELKRQGVGMIFISHHLEEIFEVCDRITVLRDGNYVGSCDVAATNVDALVEMMVGRRIENSFPPKPAPLPNRKVMLSVSDLQLKKNGPVNGFEVHEGEILGFAGLVGSGRTETALAVIGAGPYHSVRITLNGTQQKIADPADALIKGIGILPESRKTEGLITQFTCKQNISINNYGKYLSRFGFIDGDRELAATDAVMKRVGVKARGPETTVSNLSGGNQQKVVIARWLNHHANILIFDEPTRGIDVGAKSEIYALMREFTSRGFAIIMISSELPEVIGMCDRVAVFKSGKIVTTLEAPMITPEEVMRHATAGESPVAQ